MRGRRLPRGARWFLFGIVLVFGATVALLVWPVKPPVSDPLPQPNGYDDLVRAAEAVSQAGVDYRELAEPELREVLAQNAAALKLLRAGLERECRVPVKFSAEYIASHMPEVAGHKHLVQALLAEGRLAELDQRTNDAARSHLDAIRLGHEAARGGLLIHHLVGLACESMGATRLVKLAPSLDAPTCRRVAADLESIAARRESPDETLRIERAWSRHVGGLREKVSWMIASKSLDPGKKMFNRSYLPRLQAEVARQSQLALDLATRAYTLEQGKPPASANDLVPEYLKALPAPPESSAAPRSR